MIKPSLSETKWSSLLAGTRALILYIFAVANRFVAEYGVVRLSIGEAIRKVLNFQSYTELARQINLHLKAGTTVPDELAVQALEVALLDMQCQTRG